MLEIKFYIFETILSLWDNAIDFCCFGGGLEYLIWYAGSEAVTHFYALCIFMIIVLSSPVYGFYDSKWFSRSVGHYFMSRFFFIENGVFFHFLEGCNKWNFLWCESEEISQRFHRRENENIFLRTTFHEAHPLLEKILIIISRFSWVAYVIEQIAHCCWGRLSSSQEKPDSVFYGTLRLKSNLNHCCTVALLCFSAEIYFVWNL